jgi:hypothetical protein
MTQEIIELAREAGLYQDINVSFHQALRNFYDLAIAKEQKKWQEQTVVEIHEALLEEREACALVVDARLEKWEKIIGKDKMYKWMRGLPEVIRARGKQT